MKKRILCLLLTLTVLLTAAGCTETPPADNASGNSSAADTSKPQESTAKDFFTENGQASLPDKATLPALSKETGTEHLYSLELALPNANPDSASFAFGDSTVHVQYAEGNSRYYCVLSLKDGSLLSQQKIPYRGVAGMLEDEGYWIVDRNGLSVIFYTPDGKASSKLATSNSYRGSMIPNFATVSADGKAVIAGFETGAPFVIIDLETKKKTRVSTEGGSAEVWTFFGEADGTFLFSGSKGSILEVESSDLSFRQIENEIRFDGYIDGLYRVADLHSGLLLKGVSKGEDALMLLSFADSQEIPMALGSGLCITLLNSRFFVYDLRTSRLMKEFALGRICSDFSVSLSDNGVAYVTARKMSSIVCYAYDLAAACKGEGEETDLQAELFVTDDLNNLVEECAEEIALKHGIEIFCSYKGNDFPTSDYLAKAVTDVGTVFNALQEVDRILSLYPEGMIREAIGAHSGLHLYLCGDLYGVGNAEQDRVGGFTTDYGSTIVVVMDVFNGIETTLPHELSHVFDRHISSKSTMFFNWLDVWESVTPYDDAYLYTYNGYWDATDYVVGYESNYNNIWFTRSYARSYPTEDRACLMECMFDSETGFLKDRLKYNKLAYKARLYSFILRQCFESCQVEEELYWERFTGIPDPDEFRDLMEQKAA